MFRSCIFLLLTLVIIMSMLGCSKAGNSGLIDPGKSQSTEEPANDTDSQPSQESAEIRESSERQIAEQILENQRLQNEIEQLRNDLEKMAQTDKEYVKETQPTQVVEKPKTETPVTTEPPKTEVIPPNNQTTPVVEEPKAETTVTTGPPETEPDPEVIVPPDADADGIPDETDICMDARDPEQLDTDNDGIGDACDIDKDNDDIPNDRDNCPIIANADQNNIDTDELGDICDDDIDGDNVPNEFDNCPTYANADQLDANLNLGGDQCDLEIDGYTTSVIKLNRAGGSAIGTPEEARVYTPTSLTLAKIGDKKFLFIGDYPVSKIARGYLRNDGMIDKVDLLSPFNYPVMLVTMPNQKAIFGASYINGTSGSVIGKLDLDDSGKDPSITPILTNPSGTKINYPNYGTEYRMYITSNAAISQESRFIYYPVEGIGTNSSKIDCLEINPENGTVVAGPVTVIKNSLKIPTGVAIASVTTGEILENRLYIADSSGNKISMIKVAGCTAIPNTTLTTIVEGEAKGALSPRGIVISPDGSRLYFTYGASAVLSMELDHDTGSARGAPNVLAGNLTAPGFKDGQDSRLNYPRGMALDYDSKRLYVADTGNSTVKMIQMDPTGLTSSNVRDLIGLVPLNRTQETIIGNVIDSFRPFYGIASSPTVDGNRFVYTASQWSINYFKYNIKTGTTSPGMLLAGIPYKSGPINAQPSSFNAIYDLAFSQPSNLENTKWHLYVADHNNSAIRCLRLNPRNGGLSGWNSDISTVLAGKASKVNSPSNIAVSDDGKYVYVVNRAYNGVENKFEATTSTISYIGVNPETCAPIASAATVIPETYKAGTMITGLSFYKKTMADQEKWYLYFLTNYGENKVKRIELDPLTGGPKVGSGIEVIAGTGATGNVGGAPITQAKFAMPWSMTFSPDKKNLFVVDNASKAVIDIEMNDDGTAKFVLGNISGSHSSPKTAIDGFREKASLLSPRGITTMPVGENGMSLWVVDEYANAIREIR